MPSRSTCVLYGSMNEVALENFDPVIFLGRGYNMEGFILADYINSLNLYRLVSTLNQVSALMVESSFQSKIQRKIKFSEFRE